MWTRKPFKKTLKYEYDNIQASILSPSRTHVPKWYKDAERYIGGKPQILPSKNTTVKACVPFLDSLTFGYIITLSMDVLVERKNSVINLSWPTGPEPIQIRDKEGSATIPVPVGHSSDRFVWKVNIHLELPKGYSALITHPLNRHDLPFTTLSGIVDADAGMFPGNLPFFLREDFEGLIPKGTPILQLLPFKRDDWKSERLPEVKERTSRLALVSRTVLEGWYKKNGWKKKDFD